MPQCTYTVNDASRDYPRYDFESPLSNEDVSHLIKDGFLLKKSAIQGQRLNDLRLKLNHYADKADDGSLGQKYSAHEQFIRDLPLHDEIFADLAIDPFITNSARTMMGPLIRLRGSTGRVNRPGCLNDGFGWHVHQRHNLEPAAPWNSLPQGIDFLIYLDDVNEDNGALAVIPGSHLDTQRRIPWNSQQECDHQVMLCPRAGTILIMHPNVWHCSKPGLKVDEHQRRLIIISYVHSWCRSSPYSKDNKERILELYPDKKELIELTLAHNYS